MGKREDGKNIVFGVCDEMCSIMEQRGWLERVADGAMPGCWQPTDAGRAAVMAMLRGEGKAVGSLHVDVHTRFGSSHGDGADGVMSIRTPQHSRQLRMLDLNGSRIPLRGCTSLRMAADPGQMVKVDMSFIPPAEA